MAQKMTSTRNGAKKAASKKPADRRKAVPRARPASAKGGKAKPKAPPPAKAEAKRAAKPAPVALKSKSQTPVAKPQAKAQVAAKPAVKPAAEAAPKVMLPNAIAFKQAIAAAARSGAPAGARTMPAAVGKLAGQKITGPASAPAAKAAPAPVDPKKKPVSQRHGFKTQEWIVYPAHGVGRIVTIEEQEIAGISLELFVITFEKDKMTLRVPTGKSQSVGMRKLADETTVKKAMETLKGRARVKRTMWSRRAQEYEAKINSGDLISIAEVVRDLYRSESQPEQSYSERQLYEAALDRMAREIAAVEKLDERGAVQRVTEVLAKSARGRRLAAEEAESKAA
jgi:CarD family transcriptional regulator